MADEDPFAEPPKKKATTKRQGASKKTSKKTSKKAGTTRPKKKAGTTRQGGSKKSSSKKTSTKKATTVRPSGPSTAQLAQQTGMTRPQIAALINRGIPKEEIARVAQAQGIFEDELRQLRKIAVEKPNGPLGQAYLAQMKAEGRAVPPTSGGALPRRPGPTTTRIPGTAPYGMAPRPGTTVERPFATGRVSRSKAIVPYKQAQEAIRPLTGYKPGARRAGEYVRSLYTGKGVPKMALRGLGKGLGVLGPLFGLIAAYSAVGGGERRRLEDARARAAELPERLAAMSQPTNKAIQADMDEAVRLTMRKDNYVPLSQELQSLVDIDQRQLAELRQASKPSLIEAYARRGFM